MPGIQDLLQLAQGSGAPGQSMGGGAPPQGGGGMAQALSAKLQELMQDPVAMKGMQAYMQQMQGGGGAPGDPQGAPPRGPMDMPPPMTQGPGAPPPPDGAEQMATDAIDGAGGWQGKDAPTQTDIQRLEDDPSKPNIQSFDEQFGDGEAEKILQDAGGGDNEGDEPPQQPQDAQAEEASEK